MLTFWGKGIDTLSNTGRGIATLKGELAHQGMSKRVQQDVAQSGIAEHHIFHVSGLAPLHVRFHEGAIMNALSPPTYPVADCILAKFDENAFASHLGSWHPGGPLAREGSTSLLWQIYHVIEV